jgi:hypothetical protein
MDDFDEELSAEDMEELTSDVQKDPDLAVGRAAAKDFANSRILDRLMMYERRIEGSLYRTMAELRKVRLAPMRQVDKGGSGDKTPAYLEPTTDSAKQSQFPGPASDPDGTPCRLAGGDGSTASQPDHRQAALDDATQVARGDSVAERAKQSQFAEPRLLPALSRRQACCAPRSDIGMAAWSRPQALLAVTP